MMWYEWMLETFHVGLVPQPMWYDKKIGKISIHLGFEYSLANAKFLLLVSLHLKKNVFHLVSKYSPVVQNISITVPYLLVSLYSDTPTNQNLYFQIPHLKNHKLSHSPIKFLLLQNLTCRLIMVLFLRYILQADPMRCISDSPRLMSYSCPSHFSKFWPSWNMNF